MNPYDILHYDVTQYEFDELALNYAEKTKRRAGVTKLLVILLGILAVFGIIKYYAIGTVFLIFLAVMLMVLTLQQLCEAHASRKLYQSSLRAYRDYIYYFYRSTRKQAQKDRYLLLLGKCSLRLGEYENCLMAMEQLDEKRIPLYDKGGFYLQRTIAKRLLGDAAGYEQECHAYYAATNETSPDVERRRRILSGENPEECLSLIDIPEPLKQNCKKINFLFGLVWFLLLTVLFTQGRYLLPEGYEYRSWLDKTGFFIILTGGLVLVSALFVRIYRSINERFIHDTVKVVSSILLALSLAAEGIFFIFLFISSLVMQKIEIPSGNALRVVEPGYSTGNRYYVCEPKGIFFRKFLFYEDSEYNFPDEYSGNDGLGKSIYDDYYNYYSDNYSGDYYDNEYDTYDWNGGLYPWLLEEIYQALYESEFKQTDETLEFTYSAKDDLYAIMGKYELDENSGKADGAVTARKRLVYDRESKNGLYYLVICYEDYFDADGNDLGSSTIVDFYAIDKNSYQVIRADKHAWADPGSEAYRDATGE